MPGESTHTYEVTSVPEPCKTYVVGQRIRVTIANPPPTTIVLNYGGVCDGIIAMLIS